MDGRASLNPAITMTDISAFVGLDSATLATMKTQWLACLASVSVGHQSYTIAGRTFTRANLSEVTSVVQAINYAIGKASGNLTRVSYADMSG